MNTESGRFTLGEPLGQGQTGRVHRARDGSGRELAVKVIHDQLARPGAALDELLRAQRLLESLAHPGIQPVLAVQQSPEEGLRIAAELAPGGSLAARLERQGPLPVHEAVEIVSRLGAALTSAHLAGVVHGDVKPSNALVGADGAVRLTDFGHAGLVLQDELSRELADRDFLAPELLAGARPGVRADVYGLAATLQALLTGESPRRGAAWRVPPPLRPALERALSQDPERRPESVEALVRELTLAARPRRGGLVATGFTLALGLGALLWFLLDREAPPPQATLDPAARVEPASAPHPPMPPKDVRALPDGVREGRGRPVAEAPPPEAAPAAPERPACEFGLEELRVERTLTKNGYAYGFVRNHCAHAVEKPRVELVFFDPAGREVGRGLAFAAFDLLEPGERSPIRVLLKPYPEGWERQETLFGETRPASDHRRRAALEVLGHEVRPQGLGHGLDVRVRVRNADREPVKFVQVTVALRDAQGQVRSMYSGFVKPSPLEPGQEGEARVILLPREPIEPHALEAWASGVIYRLPVRPTRPE